MPRYFVAVNGVSRGPFSLEQIRETVRAGEIAAFTLMWKEGMPDWGLAEHVLADTDLLKHPPHSLDSDTLFVTPNTPVIAAYGRRLAAAMVDGLVMLVPVMILMTVPHAFFADPMSLAIGNVLALMAYVAYFTLTQGGEKGASVGKRTLEIRVVRDDGSALGDGLALGRYLLLTIFTILLVPCLVPIFHRQRKGLHDMICGTLVIEGSHKTEDVQDFSEAPVGNWSSLTWVMVSLLFMVPFGTGVIAAVSIPAYQDYVVRSKVAIAIEQARDTSDKVAAYHSEHGQWPKSQTDIGLPSDLDVADVAQMKLDDKGTVSLMFTSTLVRGRALNISIGSDGHRQCTTNLPRKYTDRACSRAEINAPLTVARD